MSLVRTFVRTLALRRAPEPAPEAAADHGDADRDVAWALGIAAFALACFGYVTARAVHLSLTYDEAATYLRYISSDALAVFKFDVATNHFLNTLLTKIAYAAGGPREWVLRLPNLAAYGAYLTFGLLLLRPLRHRVVAAAGFVLLNVNPYVLDFFSLSRGYGMAVALLMGAVFFLLEFLAQLPASAQGNRSLARSIACAVGAALANFSVLNVDAGILGVALAALLWSNARARRGRAPVTSAAMTAARTTDDRPSRRARRVVPWLPVTAVCFTVLVFSQNLGASPWLYAPVRVSVAGLADADVTRVVVSSVDARGRDTRLPFDARTRLWRADHPVAIDTLRIVLPIEIGDRIGPIDVAIGDRLFHADQQGDAWSIQNDGVMRILESGPSLSRPRSRLATFRAALNWNGDVEYVSGVAKYSAVTLAALGGLALLLAGVGRVTTRAELLSAPQWRQLASAVLWLAVFTGAPLYLLQHDAQLYYGGVDGLVADTFDSVISSSFYDKTYRADQVALVFDGVLVTLALFAGTLAVAFRRGQLAGMRREASVLALMAVASVISLLEHALFHTPYLLGRTALFYAPLFVVFAACLCDTIAGFGGAAKVTAFSVLAAAVSFSIYHVAVTANLDHTLDWRRDADTKAMVRDLGRLVARERGPGARVVLGVEWFYSAAGEFYTDLNTDAAIHMVVLPWPSDYVYVNDPHEDAAVGIIARYPEAGSILMTAPGR